MSETTFLHFEGLDHPVAMEDAAKLLPVLNKILAGWPHHVGDRSETPPFVTIKPAQGGQWSLHLAQDEAAARHWDAVNVMCDLVAEMAWERLRSDPSLLCLHAAAVEFGGRLVVFPNLRRAGKSTLSVALARLGHRVYTDDFLPLCVDPDSQIFRGIANGVAPRIRLPLPDGFSADFRRWISQDMGPENRQYKYLPNAPIAPGGAQMPLGAMVILDRQDHPQSPVLTTVPREDALTSLITQNFARTRQSGSILKTLDALTRDLPVFRLTYHCGEQAAAFLSNHASLCALPAALSSGACQNADQAPLEKLDQPTPEFAATTKYIQASGLTAMQVGQDHFLADADGLSIFRLNPGSVAIWNVLSEPADLNEIIEILLSAFQNVAHDQIATDSEGSNY